MTLLSYVSIPVYDTELQKYNSIIMVPIDHKFVTYKIVTQTDVLQYGLEQISI